MPPERSFSFEEHDEQALSSNMHDRLSYQHHQQHDPYRDAPPRDIISPPPQYFSPPPQEVVSPISPPPLSPDFQHRAPTFYTPPQAGPARRPVPRHISHDDDDAAPPPPPPHRSSPSRTFPDAQDVEGRYRRDNRAGSFPEIGRSSPPRGYFPPERNQHSPSPEPVLRSNRFPERASYSSTIPLAAGAATPGASTPTGSPDARLSRYSGRNIPLDDYPSNAHYHDSPYLNSSLEHNPAVSDASINPYNIADDGDDGFMPDPQRRSVLNMGKQRGGLKGQSADEGYPSQGRSASGSKLGALGGIFGRNPKNQTASGGYDPVRQGGSAEKAPRSEWLSRQTKGNNKMRWIVGGAIITVVLLAIIAGIIGGVISSKKSSASGSSNGVNPNANDNTAAGDLAANGDLNQDSPQIQALLNNPNLHKVFPGIDYTPWGTQYPLCMTYPPSQNNVTRDMAVLSQLTNAVRLYGTDCNQTQMVLHAIDRLGLTDMKVWLGVWIDTNQTTTDRQLAQMYTILEQTTDRSIFKGAIIGNEVLYSAGDDKTEVETELISILTGVKANFTALGYDLPVATSDLGDNWNAQLVTAVDYVMSNIHPFFAGVSATSATAWTLNFWQTHDKVLTAGDGGKVGQIISETGWPSSGGRDCGGTTGDCTGEQLTSTDVSIAGIDEMNTYLDSWVCGALENGTEYFWFEAFDEPWKVIYNTPGKDWEDKWGLMDPARVLKEGLVIPDCGGKTVS